jgi:hypothetical protein
LSIITVVGSAIVTIVTIILIRNKRK